MRRRATLAPLLLVVMGTSCADPAPATQVQVYFEADRAVRAAATNIEIVAWGGPRGTVTPSENEQSLRFSLQDIRRPDREGGEIWPVTHTLVPAEDDATRLYRIEGRLYDDPTAPPIATVRAISGFVEGRSLVLTLRFHARCLYVDPCERPDFSCDADGNCQPSRVSATGLPDIPDGGVADGGVEPACRTDLDCEDEIGCTDDTCFRGECLNEPRNDLCTGGPPSAPAGVCDPTNGCQYGSGCRETGADANCQAGDCEIASCEGDVCVRMARCRAPQVCCGGSCVNCNDGEACTEDSCVSGACQNPNAAGAPCNDGDFCTGVGTCAADGSCTPGDDPCGDATTCDESVRACVGCVDDAHCDDQEVFGSCVSLETATPDQICMGAGTQTVTTTPFTCREGVCEAGAPTETQQSCMVSGSTEGMVCDTQATMWSGVCLGDLCATSGSEMGTTTVIECMSGLCQQMSESGTSRTCVKDPDPSCFPSDGGVDSGGFDSAVTFDSGTDSGFDSGCGCGTTLPECPTEVSCGDSEDNDCDTLTDCADDDCDSDPSCDDAGTDSGMCLEPETDCSDMVDNDCDGDTDCEDSDCACMDSSTTMDSGMTMTTLDGG